MNIQLTGDALDLFNATIIEQAETVAAAKLYNAGEACKIFGMTRASLLYLPRTMLPGRTKPLYSAAAICDYLQRQTKKPIKSIKP